MLQYLIRRLLWAIVLFVAVTIVTYVIFYVTPSDPARLAAGQGATPADVAARRGAAPPRRAGLPAVRTLRLAARRRAVARHVVRQPPGRERHRPAGRAGHGRARLRRRHLLARALDSRRDHLGAPAALADRPRRDGLRPDRALGAPGLDRADLRLLLRLQFKLGPAAHADHGLRRLLQPLAGARRARCSGPTT